jgi:hypothetical protein
MKFIVVAQSGANQFRECLLGEGDTREEALTDAYGPKPWPKCAKRAIVREVSEEELEEIKME